MDVMSSPSRGLGGLAAALPAVAPQLRALRRRPPSPWRPRPAPPELSPAHLSRLETGSASPRCRCCSPSPASTVRRSRNCSARRSPNGTPSSAPPTWSRPRAGRLDVPWPPGRRLRARDAGPRVQRAARLPGRHRARAPRGGVAATSSSGRLRLRLGDTTHVLGPGDSAHFDSLTPHRIAARQDADGVEAPCSSTPCCRAPRPRCAWAPPHRTSERRHGRTSRRSSPATLWVRLIIYIAAGAHLSRRLSCAAVRGGRH